jgi:hypothetical protein
LQYPGVGIRRRPHRRAASRRRKVTMTQPTPAASHIPADLTGYRAASISVRALNRIMADEPLDAVCDEVKRRRANAIRYAQHYDVRCNPERADFFRGCIDGYDHALDRLEYAAQLC